MNVTEVVKVWCIALHQGPRVLRWFAEVKMIYTFCKMQCIGSGSKTLEGMGGQAQPITSLHRTETAPFQCVVGSTNRILIFDTRYTSVPIHMWRHPLEIIKGLKWIWLIYECYHTSDVDAERFISDIFTTEHSIIAKVSLVWHNAVVKRIKEAEQSTNFVMPPAFGSQ